MRQLCLVHLKEPDENHVRYLMLTLGKRLHHNVFGKNSLCKLQGDFPLDHAYLSRSGGRTSPTGIAIDNPTDHNDKIILMWQVLDAEGMKNIRIPSLESF